MGTGIMILIIVTDVSARLPHCMSYINKIIIKLKIHGLTEPADCTAVISFHILSSCLKQLGKL